MIRTLRYYISDSLDPYKNLAIEKYLLDSVPDDCCTLYLWQNENTVVIGKNQNPWSECRCKELESDGGRLARRLSGGGAVFHDTGNLNFTFICTEENYNLDKQLKVIQTACRLAGIETELSGRNDLLADGRKFSGNAFYNAKGKAYHHGTILINADLERMQKYLTPPKAKLSAKGVKSVGARVVNLSTLSESLTCQDMRAYMLSAFEKVYGMQATRIADIETKNVESLAKQYSSWDFLYGNTIPFSVSAESHFSWGHARLLLQINEGVISDAQLFTDAMDGNLSETVCQTINKCRFELDAIEKALLEALPQNLVQDFITLFLQIL